MIKFNRENICQMAELILIYSLLVIVRFVYIFNKKCGEM
jgi:hypothetical protein